MRVYRTLDEFDAPGDTAVSVGVFDGFHLGHARVIETLVSEAKARGLVSCVLTFTTHPRTLLTGEPQDLVTSAAHRLVLLERAGVEVAVAVAFTPALAAKDAATFLSETLRRRLCARMLVLGPDSHMGAGRAAGVSRIEGIASDLGMEVLAVEPVMVEGRPVSSTRVREAIQSGDLAAAGKLLGRRVSVFGEVVHGRGVGRRLGFPTANLDISREVRPPLGVYATWAHVEGARVPSVTNVGSRPTFADAAGTVPAGVRRDALVEAHLIEAPQRSLLGLAVELEFVRKLRNERRFGTDRDLARQIARDVDAARAALAGRADE